MLSKLKPPGKYLQWMSKSNRIMSSEQESIKTLEVTIQKEVWAAFISVWFLLTTLKVINSTILHFFLESKKKLLHLALSVTLLILKEDDAFFRNICRYHLKQKENVSFVGHYDVHISSIFPVIEIAVYCIWLQLLKYMHYKDGYTFLFFRLWA